MSTVAVVRERHVRALYINVPVPPRWLQAQLSPPAEPDIFAESAWISIVVDDLFMLQTPILGGFFTVPGMNGWMMKVNALVKCRLSNESSSSQPISGYQILSLDFEATKGLSGWVKQKGAISTQKVPTYMSHFQMSSGKSGHTDTSSMHTGTLYQGSVNNKHRQIELVSIKGCLAALVEKSEAMALVKFVVSRPVKFLAQHQRSSYHKHECRNQRRKTIDQSKDKGAAKKSTKWVNNNELNHNPAAEDEAAKILTFAPWRENYDCSTKGCMLVDVSNLDSFFINIDGVFDRVFGQGHHHALSSWWKKNPQNVGITAFLQPEYRMVDTKNVPVN